MFRPAARSILRSSTTTSTSGTRSSLAPLQTIAARRHLTAAPPHRQRSRSWRSGAARWGLAIAGIYYYNTSEIFAEQPAEYYYVDARAEDHDGPNTPTLDAITRSSREKKMAQQRSGPVPSSEETSGSEAASPSTSSSRSESESTSDATPSPSSSSSSSSSSSPSDPASLEDEASSEGAFNPVTGEINWDCPCLGGMAHGPCGEEFRAAFSCFVFSEEEPKGMDCIEKFQGMQQCFRAHPDVYAAELDGDDDEEMDEALEEEREELVRDIKERRDKQESSGRRLLEAEPPVERRSLLGGPRAQSTTSSPASSSSPSSEPHPPTPPTPNAHVESKSPEAQNTTSTSPQSKPDQARPEPSSQTGTFDEDLELMPDRWHDARSAPVSDEEKHGK